MQIALTTGTALRNILACLSVRVKLRKENSFRAHLRVQSAGALTSSRGPPTAPSEREIYASLDREAMPVFAIVSLRYGQHKD